MQAIKQMMTWGALAVLMTSGFVATDAIANTNTNEDALLKMSEEIVADYKAVRAQCAAEQDYDMKRVCFYKLRIKAWDYQQAKEYLVQHKTPLRADEMGAIYAVNH